MNGYKIPHADLKVSRIAYGCMGIGGRWDREPITVDEREAAIDVVAATFEQGINFLDHAGGVELNREEWYQLFVAAPGGPVA